jgi:hypothetical protein
MRKRTDKDFFSFLQVVLWTLKNRTQNGQPWPKGCSRFTYWNSSLASTAWADLRDQSSSPEAERVRAFDDPKHSAMKVSVADPSTLHKHRTPPSVQEQLSTTYRTAFVRGDDDSIFEFARDNLFAIQEPWVIEQLLAWRLSGTAAAKRSFNRFMRLYWGAWGKRTPENTLAIIEKDQNIYSSYLTRDKNCRKEQAVEMLADQFDTGAASIGLVLKRYSAYHRTWTDTPLFPHARL